MAHRLVKIQRESGHKTRWLVGFSKGLYSYATGIKTPSSGGQRGQQIDPSYLYYDEIDSHAILRHEWFRSADLVHLHNLHGGYFNPWSLPLISFAKPVVWTLHDMQALTGHCAHSLDCQGWEHGCGNCPTLDAYPGIRQDRTAELLAHKRSIYAQAQLCLVAPSNWLLEKLPRSIMTPHPAHHILNGVSTQVYRPVDRSGVAQIGIPEGAFVVGGVANFGVQDNPWKGGDYFRDVVEQVIREAPDVFFLNIGSAKPSDHPNIVNIPPVEDHRRMVQLYNMMDLYLTTAIAENCPLVVIEALACGVPVVAFRTGGIPDLVKDDHNGRLVPYKDAPAAVRALLELRNNRRKLNRFSLAARGDACKRLDINRVGRQYEALYRQAQSAWRPPDRQQMATFLETVPDPVKNAHFMKGFTELTEICLRAERNRRPSGSSIPFDASVSPVDTPQTSSKNTPVAMGVRPSASSTDDIIVSAIVSLYNAECFIRGCLEDLMGQSLAAQTEIIVIDSGSEEGEGRVVREFQDKYQNIVYLRTAARETVYEAWNRGIQISRGKYITNANADDRHHTDAFAIMARALDQHPHVSLVYADLLITETENETFETCTPVGRFRWLDWDRQKLLEGNCFMGPQPMWRRSLHEEYGFFNPHFITSGDYEFWLRISQTHQFLHLPIVLGLYLKSPTSIEHSNRAAQARENQQIIAAYLKADKDRVIINRNGSLYAPGSASGSGETSDHSSTKNEVPGQELAFGEVIQKAKYEYFKGHLQAARSIFNEITCEGIPPKEMLPEWLKLLALVETPETVCRRLQSLFPKNGGVAVLGAKAKAFIDSGQLEMAKAVLDGFPPEHGMGGLAQNLRGELELSGGHLESAISCFERAIAESPERPEAFLNLGHAYFQSSHMQAACAAIAKGLTLESPSHENLSKIGRVLARVEDVEKVDRLFRSSIEQYPDNKILLYQYISHLLSGKRLQAAMQMIETAIWRFGTEDGIIEQALKVRRQVGPHANKHLCDNGGVTLCTVLNGDTGRLPAFLFKAKHTVDEIVAVDVGGTQAANDIARVFGARLYRMDEHPRFDDPWQLACAMATGTWFLRLEPTQEIESWTLEKRSECRDSAKQ